MYKSLSGFGPFKGQIERRAGGVMIALENGQVTTYSLESLQERGVLFVKPGDKVYAGQVVGENARQQDMIVNPCKAKETGQYALSDQRARCKARCASSNVFRRGT